MVRLAVQKLKPLLDRIALLGGCATGLLISDPAAGPVRGTADVDVIVGIASYHEYAQLEARLRALGFREQPEDKVICRWHIDKVICRWHIDKLIVDVMPTDTTILGFGNRWYAPALRNSEWVDVGAAKVRAITAPYFLATKLEAFHGRGQGDYLASHDIEDVIAVIDGRPELIEKIRAADSELKDYLRDEFAKLLHNAEFTEAIPGHLLPDDASQERRGLIIERLNQIAALL
jgi:predicted nucleotidyltransferase